MSVSSVRRAQQVADHSTPASPHQIAPPDAGSARSHRPSSRSNSIYHTPNRFALGLPDAWETSLSFQGSIRPLLRYHKLTLYMSRLESIKLREQQIGSKMNVISQVVMELSNARIKCAPGVKSTFRWRGIVGACRQFFWHGTMIDTLRADHGNWLTDKRIASGLPHRKQNGLSFF